MKKSGALMYFHNLCGVPATLEAAPADSEAVHAEIVRVALVLPAFVLAPQGFAAQRPVVQKHVEPPRKQAESDSSSSSGARIFANHNDDKEYTQNQVNNVQSPV